MPAVVTSFALGFLATPAIAADQSQHPASGPAAPLAGFDTHVEQVLHDWNVPGVAVSIVKDGKPVLIKGYGVRDPATGQPMTEDTIFPVGSISKGFTTFSAGLLVDDKKLGFDTPAYTYLKGFTLREPATTVGLTIRDMLSHRSGYPRHDIILFNNSQLKRDELLDRIPYLEPTQPLRTGFQYNNIMFTLAGLTVERVAGTEFESFVSNRIFRPLNMQRTMFGYDRAAKDPNHSGGRIDVDGKPVTVPLYRMTPVLSPAGGIYSNARDLTNWMLVQLGGGRFEDRQIIEAATLAELHRTQIPRNSGGRDPELLPIGYGMGWFTDSYRGHLRLTDPGEIWGSTTIVALLPAKRLGVTVLVNHGASELPELLSLEIMDRFLGVTGKDWVGEGLARKKAGEAVTPSSGNNNSIALAAVAPASHPLVDYAGRYRHPGYGPLDVTLEGGRLVGRFNDEQAPLDHRSYDVFQSKSAAPGSFWQDRRLQFVSDFEGQVSSVQLVAEPALPAVAFVRLPDARLSDPGYLKGLVGTYLLDGDNVAVTLAGNRLSMAFPNGTPGELIPSLGGQFAWSRSRAWRIGFQTDAAGRASSMTLTTASGVYEGKRVN